MATSKWVPSSPPCASTSSSSFFFFSLCHPHSGKLLFNDQYLKWSFSPFQMKRVVAAAAAAVFENRTVYLRRSCEGLAANRWTSSKPCWKLEHFVSFGRGKACIGCWKNSKLIAACLNCTQLPLRSVSGRLEEKLPSKRSQGLTKGAKLIEKRQCPFRAPLEYRSAQSRG